MDKYRDEHIGSIKDSVADKIEIQLKNFFYKASDYFEGKLLVAIQQKDFPREMKIVDAMHFLNEMQTKLSGLFNLLEEE